ncbi:MAG TPA: hypothetical protein DCE42_20190 [Myxococcales bacterium]|nr:hypothetical protein [Deltaproteobacteria bacterium]MBU49134.1 hypothetical protein [Deltaproteobacteria bacterium]HAA57096.1 hypothetical protein [Myxococcales bacterium]|tara:strand:+ start:14305 stop:15060 length:756 start_codon:yes stop_codon:yes gene_type:complete
MDDPMPQDRIEQAREEALALYQQGVKAQSLGDYPKAEDCYRRCHVMMKAIGNRNGEAAALHYMGTLLEAKGEFAEALDCYRKSFHLFEADEDFQNCLFSLFFQAILSLKLDEPRDGIQTIQQALDMAFGLGTSFIQEGWSRVRQMAGVLFAERKMEDLIFLGESLDQLGEKIQDESDGPSATVKLAQMTQQLGVFLVGTAKFWLAAHGGESLPEDEVTGWLLQTAVNLDQATGAGLAFTDLAAKVIQERLL